MAHPPRDAGGPRPAHRPPPARGPVGRGPWRPPKPPPTTAPSPRIARLAEEVDGPDPRGAYERFEDERRAAGGPLVEPLVGRPDHRLITFVHRAPEADGVALLANCLTDRSLPRLSWMERLGEIWHRGFVMRADWRGEYRFAPCRAPLPELGPLRHESWFALHDRAIADPLNPHHIGVPHLPLRASVAELPQAPPPSAAWWCERERERPAATTPVTIDSAALGERRTHRLHRPAVGAPRGVLVLLDGEIWGESVPIVAALERLSAEGALPPLLTVLVSSIDRPHRARDLACSAPFVQHLTDELLPRVTAITAPERTIIAGQSLGGLAAVHAGHTAPHRFGRVLAQSGSFWWPDEPEFSSSSCRMAATIAADPPTTTHHHLQVGLQEWMLLGHVRHLRDVLRARGHVISHHEYNGGHDHSCWRVGLLDGLRRITAGWR